jgi:hypothetical protein
MSEIEKKIMKFHVFPEVAVLRLILKSFKKKIKINLPGLDRYSRRPRQSQTPRQKALRRPTAPLRTRN